MYKKSNEIIVIVTLTSLALRLGAETEDTTVALAVAATLYSVQGVEDTVYGFTEHDQNIDGALSIITNDQIPYKFKYFSIRKVVYAIRSASKTGSTLFSSAWFNLMMKQSDCYDFNNQMVNDLLD